jgi:ribulose-phosphate 3-epimerase
MPGLVNAAAVELGASLMCADQGDLRRVVVDLDRAGIDFFHFDVMDGSFVRNFALGADQMRALRPATRRPFDAHLMVVHPERHIAAFAAAGADSITIHAEAAADLAVAVEAIRKTGRKAGAAINPATPVSVLAPAIRALDLVCVMTVEPGFAGQSFIESVLPKLDELAALIRSTGSRARIQVDGAVGLSRIPALLDRGASLLVGGTSAIFHAGATPADEVVRVRGALAAMAAVHP